MADVTIAAYDGTTDNGNVQNSLRGTVLPAAGNGFVGTGAALTAAQTFEVDVTGDDDIIIVAEDTSAGANVLTLDAGDYPPSQKASKGASTFSLVASDVVMVFPPKGRHVQSDGKITGSLSAAGRLWFIRAPAGFQGKAIANASASQD